ncbi:RiPP maturation radical SAM C-methyltransferase [Eilatimonas milleporae]|uniref:Ribosomal peptide maturation radical SAM protein 1 n=1 Tax=Eilatimonas milleporae TaxID=911205 RepID=A0A3M0CNI3_9PROT|nr:RiPP maturation radical SAM C-methyltransferase [Eilatimonas milleporae]RMB04813.1 ribosomal peptide maturation radical SAM protein 1 [Eilatimonas milleporae]
MLNVSGQEDIFSIPHKDIPIGLVSMPWASANAPSLQLATLDAIARQHGLQTERHELFIDFCHHITPSLYSRLVHDNEFTLEWLFTRIYFGEESGNWLDDFESVRPKLDLPRLDYEAEIIEGLQSAAISFLDSVEKNIDWSRYDIVGLSLSTQQLGASLALARRLKQRYPNLTVVFGGSQCAGSAGTAILKFCPYVDAVVRVEGEMVFPELIRRIRHGERLDGLKGVSHRTADGTVIEEEGGALYQNTGSRPFINYDPFFEKLEHFDLQNKITLFLPYESSRGCWWGERSQCSFCGLHEIMKYRPSQMDFVLGELEHLAERHDYTRFYAVDLIAPKAFFDEFFPIIQERGHDWTMFYEVKSNLSRDEIKAFAEAGGKVIQPGIESLQAGSLKYMHKGSHALQNVQTLKWAKEFDIIVYWNYLMGFPGEKPSFYDGAAEKLPLLHHLEAPFTIRDVMITRFSPHEKTPEKYGISALSIHPFYNRILPVDQDHLDDFAYIFDADWELKDQIQDYTGALKQACKTWQAAYRNGAVLDAFPQEDGSLIVKDTRFGEERRYSLTPAEARLYTLLGEKQHETKLAGLLRGAAPWALETITRDGGMDDLLQKWHRTGLILSEGRQVIALAILQKDEEIASQLAARAAARRINNEAIVPI